MNDNSNSSKKKGLKIFLWIVLIICILLFFTGLSVIIGEKQNTNVSPEWIKTIAFGIIGSCSGLALVKMSINDRTANFVRDTAKIDKLKEIIENETNPIKKKILNDQLGHFIFDEATTRLTPLIEQYTNKISKKPKPEWNELLQQFKDELIAAKVESEKLFYNPLSDVSEENKERYVAFCDAYKQLRNSKNSWIVVSEQSNSEYKASAKTLVNRKPFHFTTGCFDTLLIPYEVPRISISLQQSYYFYPHFVIVSNNSDEIDVLPINEVNIKYSCVRFQEEGIVPSDAQRVGTTYKYVNKDGEPDRRYSNNPIFSVLKYGEIEIEPFGKIFQVSNNEAAANLRNTFVELKKSSGSSVSNELGKELANQIINTILGKCSNNEVFPEISRSFFEDIWFECKRIQEFSRVLIEDPVFLEIVGEKINGDITINGKIVTMPEEKLPVYFLGDILNCYNGLGHEIDLNKSEGLGLMLYTMLYVDPKFSIEFNQLGLCYEKSKAPTEDLLKKTNEAVKMNNGTFMIEFCLRGYDRQLHNQYVLLMYRFASLIAKADKMVKEDETKWLNEIIALKEPESEEDVIAPTIPEEKTKKKTSQALHPSPAKELEALIGLASVKAEVNSLTNYIKVQRMRQEKGMKVTPMSYHCVFTGNPGTGKTTVARIVSQIYKELGILKKGHLVETDRSGLVAEYVGQTAIKTNKIIESALDGILFIDEAYSLVDGGNSDYGKEAIATLLKRMEDDRDRLVVILAGYTDDMKRFVDSNPGLQSRFNRYIEFPDYSADELFQIFLSSAKKYEYKLTEEAQTTLQDALEKVVSEKDKNFGNGRYVRNLFEKVVENQANRLSSEADVTSESLALIVKEDIEKSL